MKGRAHNSVTMTWPSLPVRVLCTAQKHGASSREQLTHRFLFAGTWRRLRTLFTAAWAGVMAGTLGGAARLPSTYRARSPGPLVGRSDGGFWPWGAAQQRPDNWLHRFVPLVGWTLVSLAGYLKRLLAGTCRINDALCCVGCPHGEDNRRPLWLGAIHSEFQNGLCCIGRPQDKERGRPLWLRAIRTVESHDCCFCVEWHNTRDTGRLLWVGAIRTEFRDRRCCVW